MIFFQVYALKKKLVLYYKPEKKIQVLNLKNNLKGFEIAIDF